MCSSLFTVENSGYKSSKKNLNKRKRAAHKKRVNNVLGETSTRNSRNPILRSVENLPNKEVRQAEVQPAQARPRIIRVEQVDIKVKIVSFKKGHRIPPPTVGDYRDKLLCKRCRVNYKNEFCITCVKLKLGVVPDRTLVFPDESLDYFPIADSDVEN